MTSTYCIRPAGRKSAKLSPFGKAREYVAAYTGHLEGEDMVAVFDRCRRHPPPPGAAPGGPLPME